MKGFILTFISSVAFTILGALGGIVIHYPDWRSASALALIGFFLGSTAAPFFDRSAFIFPRVHQSVSGALAGITIGYVGNSTILAMGIGAIAGAIIGFLAPFWIKHVTFP